MTHRTMTRRTTRWITPAGSPTLAAIKYYGTPRDQWAWQWLCLNFPDGIPDDLGEAWEIVPDDLRPEIELYYAKTNGAQ